MGHERAHSVLNALQYLQTVAGAEDWVLVHDAARPCVSTADIRALLAETDSAGAILASPVCDTVKKVTDCHIDSTLDRSRLWAAQTPQMFPLGELLQALNHALMKNLSVTDEASAMELAGRRPRVVPASRHNIKVTHPEDLALAELILGYQARG